MAIKRGSIRKLIIPLENSGQTIGWRIFNGDATGEPLPRRAGALLPNDSRCRTGLQSLETVLAEADDPADA